MWLATALLLCRVVPLFRGWTGCYGDEDIYQDCRYEDEEEEEEDEHRAPVNFGRPLQPAQQRQPLTSEPDACWALLVAKFGTCASSLSQ